jgi:hypothetical protein
MCFFGSFLAAAPLALHFKDDFISLMRLSYTISQNEEELRKICQVFGDRLVFGDGPVYPIMFTPYNGRHLAPAYRP